MTTFTDIIEAKEQIRADGKTVDRAILTEETVDMIMAHAMMDGSGAGDEIATTEGLDLVVGDEDVLVADDGTRYEL